MKNGWARPNVYNYQLFRLLSTIIHLFWCISSRKKRKFVWLLPKQKVRCNTSLRLLTSYFWHWKFLIISKGNCLSVPWVPTIYPRTKITLSVIFDAFNRRYLNPNGKCSHNDFLECLNHHPKTLKSSI